MASERVLKWIRRALRPETGDSLPVDVGRDGLAVPAEVPGDRRDRPAPAPQCMCFHVFPMCEHAERVSLRAGCLVAVSFEGGPTPLVDGSAHLDRVGNFSDRGWRFKNRGHHGCRRSSTVAQSCRRAHLVPLRRPQRPSVVRTLCTFGPVGSISAKRLVGILGQAVGHNGGVMAMTLWRTVLLGSFA